MQKCGELEDARQIFYSMDKRVVVTWTVLIAGYTQQGLGQEALVVCGQMEEASLILADHVTIACLGKACASTGATQKGRGLHSKIIKRGLLGDVHSGNDSLSLLFVASKICMLLASIWATGLLKSKLAKRIRVGY